MKTHFSKVVVITSISILSLVVATTGAAIAQQERSLQTRQGLPGRRISGGTRCDCTGRPTLVALNPRNNLGTTISATPSVYFLVSQTEANYPIEFSLRDSAGNKLYEAALSTKTSQGIVEIQLPEQMLKVDEDYRWRLSIVYDAEDPLQDDVLSGYLRRVTPEDYSIEEIVAITNDQSTSDQSAQAQHTGEQSIAAQLETAKTYQQAGLWNDAIGILASLYHQHPTNEAVRTSWHQLLQALDLATVVASREFTPTL